MIVKGKADRMVSKKCGSGAPSAHELLVKNKDCNQKLRPSLQYSDTEWFHLRGAMQGLGGLRSLGDHSRTGLGKYEEERKSSQSDCEPEILLYLLGQAWSA